MTDWASKGGNVPTSYGAILRIQGNYIPEMRSSHTNHMDSYFISVDADGGLYSGTAVNNAYNVTWTAK